jgi:hypothetical protein
MITEYVVSIAADMHRFICCAIGQFAHRALQKNGGKEDMGTSKERQLTKNGGENRKDDVDIRNLRWTGYISESHR